MKRFSSMRRVTIGIPSFNEEQNILNLLNALESQYIEDFAVSEVIISDDSSDGTPQIVKRFANDSSLDIRLFHHSQRRGAAAAWNEIFETATGDVIVLYDADTIPHSRCTAELVSGIRGKVALCASNPQPVQVNGVAGRASRFISDWLRSVRRAGLSKYTVMGRALSVDARAARRVKMPLNTIAIDLYLQCKVLEQGLGVTYNDRAVVYFRPANSMQDLASQVIRAINGHEQINEYVLKFMFGLPPHVAFIQTMRTVACDPTGAISAFIGYLTIPYYRARLAGTNSSEWHTARSSKVIDPRQLRSRF